MSQGENKLHIDSDWKAQAQAEKEKLASQAKAAPAGKQAGAQPGANFETLVSTIIHQALFALGAIPDPRTGQRMQHLELARHQIDMLTVLEDKTKGNLTKEEEELLKTATYELRTRYIQVASAARGG
jgi:hypothetical protein